MIVTVLSYKGGVGKTTTAIHLASCLHARAPTVLVDGDAIRSATKWDQRSKGKALGFKVIGHMELARQARSHTHIVIDTQGNPSEDDFADLARACDLLVVPATAETVATDGLTHTLAKLAVHAPGRYRVLLTMVPPKPQTDAQQLRAELVRAKVPIFRSEIPRLVAFQKAATLGVVVHAVRDDRNAARAWDAYAQTEQEIMNV